MLVKELWSEGDSAAAESLVEACGRDDLLQALIAIEGASELTSQLCRRQVGRWGERLSHWADRGPEVQAAAMAELLGESLGFRGDADDYYNPRNSWLSQVLTRRQGLPILMAGVWILVGRAAGLRVEGIGLPGHFIAGLGIDEVVLVDPFHGGREMTVEQCQTLVSRLSVDVAWSDDFLDPVPVDRYCERVLSNLVGSWAQRGEAEPLYRTLGMLSALRPEVARIPLQQAKLAERIGAISLAAHVYHAVVDGFPSSAEADEAAQRLDAIGDSDQYLN